MRTFRKQIYGFVSAHRLIAFIVGSCVIVMIAILTLGAWVNAPPRAFPVNDAIVIERGENVRDIGRMLRAQRAIRSTLFFNALLALSGSSDKLQAGVYTFPVPLSTLEIVSALESGIHSKTSTTLTIPEGLRTEQIDALVTKTLPHIPEGAFARNGTQYEGYLFPDTYFIPESYTSEDVVDLMRETFNRRIEPYENEIADSGRTLSEIVTMASILEREGNSKDSMERIAGVLWKRLDSGMLLQADATLWYVLGKSSTELTVDDLAIDSPYNSYRYRGLPPAPIGNPGITAIEAALRPKGDSALFYLTGLDGEFYFAETFEQHVENKRRYLNN